MLRRISAVSLAFMFLFMAMGFQSTVAQTVKSQAAQKARAEVQRFGVGPDARVELKLQDNTKWKGYVSAVAEDSFTITDSKTGTSQTIAFAEVTSVKKQGSGLSTKSLIIIGAVAAGGIITWIAVKPALCDGGAQTRFPC